MHRYSKQLTLFLFACTVLLSFITICLLIVKNQTSTDTCTNQTLTETIADDNVVCDKYDIDQLLVYEPHFAAISLSVPNYSPDFENSHPIGESHVLSVAAAYTHTYNWTVFSHNLIEGNHVVDGKFYEGSPCAENTGAFTYAKRHWQIVYKDFKDAIKRCAGYDDACAFEQTMLVFENKPVPLPIKLVHKPKNIRRAICDYHNHLVIMESKVEQTYEEFAKCLASANVFAALYLDMGDQSYSLWRERESDDLQDIHPKTDKWVYATNYLNFLWVN